MIEIEQRGYLTKEFKDWLDGNAEKIDEYDQVNIFCQETSDVDYVFDKKKYTMSVVLTKRGDRVLGKAKVKKGDYGAVSRQEYEFDFDPKDTPDLLGVLETLGINGYCPREYHRTDYKYGNFEISAKENGLLADHFEVEMQVEDESKVGEGKKMMDKFFAERGVKIFKKNEYELLLRKIFEDNPPVQWDQISLDKFK
ncbi:hypothetical protein KJ855_04750 [Patescibacteria group bacterium]|nr:hypothetical protein [Patescibacteria group bacterium]